MRAGRFQDCGPDSRKDGRLQQLWVPSRCNRRRLCRRGGTCHERGLPVRWTSRARGGHIRPGQSTRKYRNARMHARTLLKALGAPQPELTITLRPEMVVEGRAGRSGGGRRQQPGSREGCRDPNG